MSNEPDPAATSDGYHTLQELYEHRCLLFIAVLQGHPDIAWRSRLHDDGTGEPGWWVAGLKLPEGEVTYHLPDRMWPLLDGRGIATLERAPKYDGHTSADVLVRLTRWLERAGRVS